MKKIILLPFLIIISFLFISCTADSTSAANNEKSASNDANTQISEFPIKYCPVTQPPQKPFTPPDPYKQEPYPGQFFYGTEELWTALPNDHLWQQLPYDPEHGYGQKIFFQRAGYNWREEPEPALTVTGRKIDPESTTEELLTALPATNGYTPDDGSFMLVGAQFPTPGCWEITGQYGKDSLTFVIWIGSTPSE